MTTTLEPKGKLDATKVVNGPEGGLWGCDAVSWRAAEENVRRLRQRIFTASQAGDLKRVRNLQKLMLRSRSSALVSVRRQGARTPGVDGLTVADVEETIGVPGFLDDLRAGLKDGLFRPLPVRERKIPKPGGSGKLRKLGIPTEAA